MKFILSQILFVFWLLSFLSSCFWNPYLLVNFMHAYKKDFTPTLPPCYAIVCLSNKLEVRRLYTVICSSLLLNFCIITLVFKSWPILVCNFFYLGFSILISSTLFFCFPHISHWLWYGFEINRCVQKVFVIFSVPAYEFQCSFRLVVQWGTLEASLTFCITNTNHSTHC